ncbi:MAG: hypothetical protein ACQER9_01195 [Nanobdellota archaeon]
MNDIKGITDKVLKKIKPLDEGKFIVEEILNSLKYNSDDVEFMIGGSYAKGTHIGNKFDCDIFARFKTEDKDLSKKLKVIVEKVCNYLGLEFIKVKGSRDYFQIYYKNITFEIIPVKYIEDVSEAENIMDFSPFHVAWVKKEIFRKDLRDDIRLMKQFLKSCRVYGAESYIKGFSGHVNDILVLYYGGFIEAIKKIAKWDLRKKIIIDYCNYYKGKDVEFFMHSSKINSSLIVVDPIMKERNAAAALSSECLIKLIECAKYFLKKPSEDYFIVPEINEDYVKSVFGGKILKVVLKVFNDKKDIAGAKALKSIEYIVKRMKKEGFSVNGFDWKFDFDSRKAYAFISLDSFEIESFFIRKGPSSDMKEAVEAFKSKHDKVFEKNGFIYSEDERNYTDVKTLILDLKEDNYFDGRVEIE